MASPVIALVRTTVARRADALRLARRFVEERLAACAQVHAVDSTFRWDGVERAREWSLELKTSARQAAAAVRRLRELHPYNEPVIETLHAQVLPSNAAWVRDATRPPRKRR